MSFTQRLCATAACLCVALLMFSPSISLAGQPGAGAVAARTKAKCRKGYVRRGGKCAKQRKRVALKVPADGSYTGTGGLSVTVVTMAGERAVSVRAMVPLTCAPSGATENVGFLVRSMPLSGTAFTGRSAADPEFGQTTMSGRFASAKSLHLTAQVADYRNGSDTCTGQLDVTTSLHAGP
jgi:hypothetical protein